MKNLTKITGLFLVGIGLFSFAIVDMTPISAASIRDNFIQANVFSDYDAVDTTITIVATDSYSDEMVKLHPMSLCGLNPGYAAYSLYQGLDTGYQYFDASVLARYKALFGADLIKGQLKLAAKDYEGKPIGIN